ncbi:hypothetical protein AOLI_G00297190 [Acnodon oligacanthus]
MADCVTPICYHWACGQHWAGLFTESLPSDFSSELYLSTDGNAEQERVSQRRTPQQRRLTNTRVAAGTGVFMKERAEKTVNRLRHPMVPWLWSQTEWGVLLFMLGPLS